MSPKELSRIEWRAPRSARREAAIVWIGCAVFIAVVLVALRWWLKPADHGEPVTPEERIAAALEAQVRLMRDRDEAPMDPAAALPGEQWSIVTLEEPGAVLVTISIDGAQHHGRGATVGEARAKAVEAWRGAGGQRSDDGEVRS